MNLSAAIDLASAGPWLTHKDARRSRANALRVCAALGDPDVAAVGPVELDTWARAQTVGGPTVNRLLSATLVALKCAYLAGARPTPPPACLRRPEGRHRRRVVTPSELETLTRHLGRFGPFAVFLAETGLRVGEAHGLLRADMREVNGRTWATVRDTKNGDDRTVPLTARALAALPRAARPWGHVDRSAFSRAWSRARHAMGLSGDLEFVPHALRHTRASTMLRAGVPVASIQAFLGHRNIATTMRYAHTSSECLEAALVKVGA